MARANHSDADKRLEELVQNLYGMKEIGDGTKVGVFITLGLSGP
jgi:hypothetical protein